MKTTCVLQWCDALDVIADARDPDALCQLLSDVDQRFAEWGPLSAIALDEGQCFLDALNRLRDAIDNVTSVFTRHKKMVERDLVRMQAAKVASGRYATLGYP